MRRAELRQRNGDRGPRGIHVIERHGEIAPRTPHLAFFRFTAHKATRNAGLGIRNQHLGTRNHDLGSGRGGFGNRRAGNWLQRAGNSFQSSG